MCGGRAARKHCNNAWPVVVTSAEHCTSEPASENPLICIGACGADNYKFMGRDLRWSSYSSSRATTTSPAAPSG
ncbi:hypothetical protein ACOSQ2_002132 [Xanthoceras sorbifolium]